MKLEKVGLGIDRRLSGFNMPGPVRWKVKSDRTDRLRILGYPDW
jgi:hypothetical protein